MQPDDPRLESLLAYRSQGPEPSDLRAFWGEAQRELELNDPQQVIKAAAFEHPACRAYEMSFNGIGGARLRAKLLRPAQQREPGPALLLFHGYTANNGDWMHKLPWVAAGFTVAALDCRGQGGASDDPGGQKGQTLHGHLIRGLAEGPRALAYTAHFLDAARAFSLLRFMEGVDPERVAVMGGSQGGALALACAALRPGVAKAVVHYPFLSDFRQVFRSGARHSAYGELWDYFRRRDPLLLDEQRAFNALSYIDVQNLAPWIQAEVLFGASLLDEACPPQSQFAAYNRLGGPKQLLCYPCHGHEELPGWDDRAWGFLKPLLQPQAALTRR